MFFQTRNHDVNRFGKSIQDLLDKDLDTFLKPTCEKDCQVKNNCVENIACVKQFLTSSQFQEQEIEEFLAYVLPVFFLGGG